MASYHKFNQPLISSTPGFIVVYIASLHPRLSRNVLNNVLKNVPALSFSIKQFLLNQRNPLVLSFGNEAKGFEPSCYNNCLPVVSILFKI